jgi:hypothetical protein
MGKTDDLLSSSGNPWATANRSPAAIAAATARASLIFRPSDDWRFEIAKAAKSSKSGGEVADIIAEFPSGYDFLADGAPKTLGLDARSTVLKVSTSAIRDELRNRGFLDADENDAITPVSRGHFFRAKKALLNRGIFLERKKQIWRR